MAEASPPPAPNRPSPQGPGRSLAAAPAPAAAAPAPAAAAPAEKAMPVPKPRAPVLPPSKVPAALPLTPKARAAAAPAPAVQTLAIQPVAPMSSDPQNYVFMSRPAAEALISMAQGQMQDGFQRVVRQEAFFPPFFSKALVYIYRYISYRYIFSSAGFQKHKQKSRSWQMQLERLPTQQRLQPSTAVQ